MSVQARSLDPALRPQLLRGQGLHALALVCLVGLLWQSWRAAGRPHGLWFWTAAALPISHQLYVWLAWRLELESSGTSRRIGFRGYLLVFFLLFGGRFLTLALLAWVDRGSLGLIPSLRLSLTGTCLLLGGYAMYSVVRFFGLARAAGGDHFEEGFRSQPLVQQGIFRWTRNGMYVFAFLLFWAIALGLDSKAALLVAAFSHIYIWVHYLSVERPDMEYLYGAS